MSEYTKQRYNYINDEKLQDIRSILLGNQERCVAVFGAFDTWPYIHKICVDIALQDYTAITSRYIYRKGDGGNDGPDSGYVRVKRDHKYDGVKMNEFLQENVIKPSKLAVIVYSVPASHYAETVCCNSLGIRTLGIAFVRSIHDKNYCEDCILNGAAGFSYCGGFGNAGDCIDRKACPFKEQGISKNQLEYFLTSKEEKPTPEKKMFLIAVEKLEKTPQIISDFLENRLNLPQKLPQVFEFRIDISQEKFNELSKIFEDDQKKSEDCFNPEYEYIDHYYKPKYVDATDWLNKNRSIRIRESKKPLKEETTIYNVEIEPTAQGFYCKEPFGGMIWHEGKLETSKKWLEEMGMECFLKVIKKGMFSYMENTKEKSLHNIQFKCYIESIEVENPVGNQSKKYDNHSLEIELWTDKTQNIDEIVQIKNELINLLDVAKFQQQQIEPVQAFTYKWAKSNGLIP